MEFDDLKLLPGTRVKLVVAGSDGNLPAVTGKYVGFQRPQAVVVAVPASAMSGAMRVGAKVACSLVTATGIVNFTSQVEGVNSTPFTHIFLTYPKTINVRNVRAAVRVDINLPAQVANLDSRDMVEMQPSQIIDMSVLGLKLGSSTPLGDIGDELAIHIRLAFEDIGRNVIVNGKIRTQTQSQIDAADTPNTFPYVLGVEFVELDEDKRVLLYAFVLNMVQRYGAQV